jgi:LysM repeat protein
MSCFVKGKVKLILLTNKRFLVYLRKNNILRIHRDVPSHRTVPHMSSRPADDDIEQEKIQEAGMITRSSALVQAASISLLLMFSPGTTISQDQKEPAPEPPAAAPQTQTEPRTNPADTSSQPSVAAPVQPGSAETAVQDEEQTPPPKEEYSEHIIKQGDTLWDIASRYLRDPFLWPFIWRANPSVTNPDLIYAGNKLAIPSLGPIERAMQAPIAAASVEKEAPPKQAPPKPVAPTPTPVVAPVQEESKPMEGIAAARVLKPKPAAPEEPEAAPPISRLVLPEEQQQPIIDKYAMLSAGFVDSFDGNDRIVGGQEEAKTTFGYGDVVYVSMSAKQNVRVGDKFLIYTVQGAVKHPRSGDRLGHLVRGLGILQITNNDPSVETLTAKITLSFDSISKKDLFVPYQEPALVYQQRNKSKDISGYIIEVTDKHTISGQTDFVYLDKGGADGVEPGDRFIVYGEPKDRDFPWKKIGEVQVFLVKDHSSTAVVRKSSDTLTRGNPIVYAK